MLLHRYSNCEDPDFFYFYFGAICILNIIYSDLSNIKKFYEKTV